MIYLSSFSLSSKMVKNPNIYPYHVFAKKTERVFLFSNITILYGNNASGKSTALNIIANQLRIEGLIRIFRYIILYHPITGVPTTTW